MRYMRMWLGGLALWLGACAPLPDRLEPTTLPTTSVPAMPPASTESAATALTRPATAPATIRVDAPTETPTAIVATVTPTAAPTRALLTGTFVKGEVPVSGSYTLDVASYTLTLSDDFQTVPGPDLYVILSGVGDTSLDFHTFSAQVLEAPLLRLGPLASPVGAQTYQIPEGTGLAVYQSVVIWCEAFSVEFAAAPLRP